jgi:hypothetical protein
VLIDNRSHPTCRYVHHEEKEEKSVLDEAHCQVFCSPIGGFVQLQIGGLGAVRCGDCCGKSGYTPGTSRHLPWTPRDIFGTAALKLGTSVPETGAPRKPFPNESRSQRSGARADRRHVSLRFNNTTPAFKPSPDCGVMHPSNPGLVS